MKKSFLISLLSGILCLAIFSCATVKDLLGTPKFSMKSVTIGGLDLEGITFKCNYDVSNPYPLGFSLKSVSADVYYDTSTKFTSISAAKGVSVAAMGTSSNSFTFKVPYDTILTYAKNTSGKKSLPFSVKGKAALNTSSILGTDLSLPFSKSFDVPVFKPSFSVSNVKLKLPTVATLTKSLVSGGMSAGKAATLAAAMIAGKSISEDAFDGINMDLNMNFDLGVKNSGSSAWKYALDSCSLNTASGSLADVSPAGTSTISSSSGTIPMTAKLNTVKAGKFIAQLINKSGKNPTFQVASKLSFPELSNVVNIPLNFSKEISLSSIGISKN